MLHTQSLIYIIILSFISIYLIGQEENMPCGFDGHHNQKLEMDSVYKKSTIFYEKDILENKGILENRSIATYTIPVIIHIMHLPEDNIIGEGSNISDAQIQAGIIFLNDAFRNLNEYSGGPFFTNSGISSVDTEIEFCLSTTTPSGDASTGINRFPTEYSNLYSLEFTPSGFTQTYQLKTLSNWDTNNYLNIWLVNDICEYSTPSGCGILGLSTFPPSHGYLNDGIVIRANTWGTNFNNNKVAVHEVGHYLGLYHTFQGGCTETNCDTGGDKICDTPPDNSTSSVAGGVPMNTCANDAEISNSPFLIDVEDIYENYMDYGSGSLKNTFTPGQKSRMISTLTSTRASLFDAPACFSAALPIELVSFECRLIEKTIELNWTTTNEINNDYFIVERKKEGGIFEEINKVLSKGTIVDFQEYSIKDTEIFYNQTLYYRLSQVDFDGSINYLGTKKIEATKKLTSEIFPNPISENGFLKYTSLHTEKAYLKIINSNGNVVFETAFEAENDFGQIPLETNNLPSGLYFSILNINNNNLLNKFIIR